MMPSKATGKIPRVWAPTATRDDDATVRVNREATAKKRRRMRASRRRRTRKRSFMSHAGLRPRSRYEVVAAVRAHLPASSSSSASAARVAPTTACAADSSYADIAKTLRSLDALVAQKLVAVQRDNDALRDDVRYLTQRIDAQLARSLDEHRKRRVASRDTVTQPDLSRAAAADAVTRTRAAPQSASGSADAGRQQSVAPRGSVARPIVGGGGVASSHRQESARSTPQSADGVLRHPSRGKPSLASGSSGGGGGGGGDRDRVRAPDVGAGKRPSSSTSSSHPNEPRSRPRTR